MVLNWTFPSLSMSGRFVRHWSHSMLKSPRNDCWVDQYWEGERMLRRPRCGLQPGCRESFTIYESIVWTCHVLDNDIFHWTCESLLKFPTTGIPKENMYLAPILLCCLPVSGFESNNFMKRLLNLSAETVFAFIWPILTSDCHTMRCAWGWTWRCPSNFGEWLGWGRYHQCTRPSAYAGNWRAG
jgi:hypothetical protein